VGGTYATRGKQGLVKDGEFNYPTSVTLFSNPASGGTTTRVFVGDEVGIQCFSPDGGFLYRLGKSKIDQEDGGFNWVYGMVAPKEENVVYVSDNGNHRLQVWKCQLES